MKIVMEINTLVNEIVWGLPAMICIVGAGIYLTIGTGFIQIRKFPYAIAQIFGRLFDRQKAGKGAISPFQAVCTALAGTIGTGSIAGVAGAIAIGGPGAVFWMWCSAFLGMCTKFAEVSLAVFYRSRGTGGELVGGPMYNIRNGLSRRWIWLAYLYCAFGVLAVAGTGNATQVNTIVTAVNTAIDGISYSAESGHSLLNLALGILIAILVAVVLLGGVQRIGRVTEKLIPFMALFYIFMALGVVVFNIDGVPDAFESIISGAFNPQAATGGAVGSVFLCMRKGVSRGIFTNEAGLGTGSIAHACADTDDPVGQGMFGIFEVFCTIIICTLTALVTLCGNEYIQYGKLAGAELTISGFVSLYGNWASIFTAAALCCFAFSTVIGWGLYGSRFMEFLFGSRTVRPFFIVYSLVSVLGAVMDMGIVWDISDTFNGLMVIPNLISLLLLSGTVFRLTGEKLGRKR